MSPGRIPVNGNITFNPIIVDGVMYVQGTGNAIVALDAATGKEIWTHANQGGSVGAGSTTGRAPTARTGGCCISTRATSRPSTRRTARRSRHSAPTAAWTCGLRLWREARNPLQTSNPGRDLREPDHHLAAGTGRWLRIDARRRPGLRRAHGEDRRGSSTASRIPASSATTRGRRARTRRRAACTTGAS